MWMICLCLHSVPNILFIQFFLTTLRSPEKELAYYIGIQVSVPNKGPGQMPANPGTTVVNVWNVSSPLFVNIFELI